MGFGRLVAPGLPNAPPGDGAAVVLGGCEGAVRRKLRLSREPAGAREPAASTPGPLQVQLDGLACTAVPPISRPEKLAPSMDSDECGTFPPFDDGSRARFRADALPPAVDALGTPLLADGNDAVGTVMALRPWPGVHARDGSAGLVEKSMSAPLRGGGTLSRIESSLAMRARPRSMADGALPHSTGLRAPP